MKYWSNEPAAGPLTREVLEQAHKAILQQGSEPVHRCELDGHVTVFGTTTCMYCRYRTVTAEGGETSET